MNWIYLRRKLLTSTLVIIIMGIAFEAHVWTSVSAWTKMGGGLGFGAGMLLGPPQIEITQTTDVGKGQDFEVFLKTLRRVNSLPACKMLSIFRVPLDAGRVAAILRSVNITSFRAENTMCDDNCLDALTHQNDVEYIGLVDVPVTRDGILQLLKCRSLVRVDVKDVQLSAVDMEILSEKFGDRIVIWELESNKPLEKRFFPGATAGLPSSANCHGVLIWCKQALNSGNPERPILLSYALVCDRHCWASQQWHTLKCREFGRSHGRCKQSVDLTL